MERLQKESIKESDISFSRSCYYICMAVIGYSIVGYLILRHFHIDPMVLFPPCGFYDATGYYCMGCGGTRAVLALFRGDFVQSFCYHPLVIVVIAFLLIFLPSQTLNILTRNRFQGLMLKPVHLYLWVGITLLQWFVKNAIYVVSGIHII